MYTNAKKSIYSQTVLIIELFLCILFLIVPIRMSTFPTVPVPPQSVNYEGVPATYVVPANSQQIAVQSQPMPAIPPTATVVISDANSNLKTQSTNQPKKGVFSKFVFFYLSIGRLFRKKGKMVRI